MGLPVIIDTFLRRLTTGLALDSLPGILQQIGFGNMLQPTLYDSGTITGVVAFTPAGVGQPMGTIESVRVVSSGTSGAVGQYIVGDSGATGLDPAASTAAGVCVLSADRTTLTFLHTCTRVIVSYTPAPAVPLSTVYSTDI